MEKLLVKGKTKDLYDIGGGLYKLYFKDDMTGKDGVFDPGANEVGLTLEGAGDAGLRLSVHFFQLLNAAGYATHFVSANIPGKTMVVKPARAFGCGLEIICRFVAMGSFVRRYGLLVEENTSLPAVVEMTIKNDAAGDPLITQEALEALGVLQPYEYEELVKLTKGICEQIKNNLAARGLELCDIKLEFGKDEAGNILLIDEFSAGNMRVREAGDIVPPLELAGKVL
ncbi:MAG: phosphoribosylaminoimidazolesuccinocarboxamide synthase [Defluviitaleaceae bacterium]|nr:phosphoribosylaminoimidazolesuccinocarboxamide synthase [Defluviitaleaceae bacterium]